MSYHCGKSLLPFIKSITLFFDIKLVIFSRVVSLRLDGLGPAKHGIIVEIVFLLLIRENELAFDER